MNTGHERRMRYLDACLKACETPRCALELAREMEEFVVEGGAMVVVGDHSIDFNISEVVEGNTPPRDAETGMPKGLFRPANKNP